MERFFIDLELLAFRRIQEFRRRQLIAFADFRQLKLFGRQRRLFLRFFRRWIVFNFVLQDDRRWDVVFSLFLSIFAFSLVVLVLKFFQPVIERGNEGLSKFSKVLFRVANDIEEGVLREHHDRQEHGEASNERCAEPTK